VPNLAFVDVGWGSDVEASRHALPEVFFSLRLNPARLRNQTPEEVSVDIERLLARAGPAQRLALCCVSLDADTPDENVRAVFEAALRYRR
jgi:hypothetical protein